MFDLVHFTRDYLMCMKCPFNKRLAIGQDYCEKWQDMCVTLVQFNACDDIKEKNMACKGKTKPKK